MADGSIIIDTNINTSGIDKGIGDIKSKLGGIATTLAGTFASVVAGATTAAGATFMLAQKASDLSEGQNVVRETFKQSSEEVLAWSKNVDDSAGISETASIKYVGSMGAMLKSSGLTEDASRRMAESMVQLTGDMSSFYNLDNDTAWEKIRSGIAGETEPLKQLGINMSVANLEAFALSQGIKQSYQEMTQAQQTTLRYNYLLSVTRDAQGDFARTLNESFANQLRVAQMKLETIVTDIGKKVLPAFMTMSKAINEELASDELSQNLDTIGNGLVTIIEKMSGVVADIIPNLIKGISFLLDQGALILSLIGGIITSMITFQAVSVLTSIIVAWQEATLAIALFSMGQTALAIKQAVLTGVFSAWEILVGVITGKVTLATAAQWLWNAAMNANPVGILITLLAGLVAGIAIYNGVTGKATDETDKLMEQTAKTKKEFEDFTVTTNKKVEAQQSELDNVVRLSGELESLSKKENKSADDKARMKLAIDEINKVIPNAITLTDSETMAYNIQSGSIEKLISRMRALSILKGKQALYDKANENIAGNDFNAGYYLDKINDLEGQKQKVLSDTNGNFKNRTNEGASIDRQLKAAKEAYNQTQALGKEMFDARADYENTYTTFIKEFGDVDKSTGNKKPDYETNPLGGVSKKAKKAKEDVKTLTEVYKDSIAEREQADENYNDKLKAQGKLTAEQELYVLKQRAKRYREQATDVLTTDKVLNKDRLELSKEYAQKAEDVEVQFFNTQKDLVTKQIDNIKDIKTKIENAYKEIGVQIENEYNKLQSYGKLFQEITTTIKEGNKPDVVYKTVELGDLNKQANELQKYLDKLEAIKKRGASQDFFSVLRDMSVEDGTKFAEKLLSISDEEFNNYMKAYELKQEKSLEISKKLYKTEAENVEKSFGEQLKTAFEALPEEFRNIGINVADVFSDGLNNQLTTKLKEITQRMKDAVTNTMTAARLTPTTAGATGSSSSTSTAYSPTINLFGKALTPSEAMQDASTRFQIDKARGFPK